MNENTMDQEPSAGGAEKAFKDLLGQVSVLRQTQEKLIEALAKQPPVDYTPTLGEISKRVGQAATRLEHIEQVPALRMAPADYQRAIQDVGERVMNGPANKLTEASGAMQTQARHLEAMIGTVRTRRAQLKWLLSLGAAAFVAGLVLAPWIARALPFGWDAGVAATVMHKDRWNAGADLMKSANPEGWEAFAEDIRLANQNHVALGTCRAAAAKLKKPQACAILMPAP
jgi:hypothetical protein